MRTTKTSVLATLALLFTLTASAQSGLVGFANYSDMGLHGTTGGKGGKIVHVTTREEFTQYAGADEPYIIILDADLKGHYDYSANPKQKHDVISVKSNKTIIGGGKGAHLDSLGLDINGQQNIIIRNLRITKADPDAIAFRDTHHVWVDHCDLSSQKEARDENDGLLDFTYGSSYLTVSWCKFHDHDKTSICSSGTRNISDYGRQRVTYHHNAFINCTQRNPRIGYGLGHIFNDYNQDNSSYAIGMFARAVVNVENCYFKNVKEAFNQMYATSADDAYWGFVRSTGNLFDNTSNGTKGNSDEGFDVSRYYMYDFALDKAADVPGLVSAMGCTEGIEGDIIPFPGDGAIGIQAGIRPSCSDIEGATDYIYTIGVTPESMHECRPEEITLAPSTTYYWQVRVVGGKYDGKTSGIFRFATADTKAHTPSPADGDRHAALREIVGESVPCAPLTLRWRESFDAEGYTVSVGQESDMTDAVSIDVDQPAYRPANLRHGETYYWRVDTKRQDGTIAEGDVWSFSSDISLAHAGRNEVEHAVRGGLCFPERDVTANWIIASNDSCNVGDQGPGYMSFVWDGEPGAYNLGTAYFDESSGQGWFSVYVNEEQHDEWTASANNNKMAIRQTNNVALAHGDEIRIEFYTQKNMRCRTDYIDITPDPTGIHDFTTDNTPHKANEPIYNLAGQRITTPVKGQIYIKGNKKFIQR